MKPSPPDLEEPGLDHWDAWRPDELAAELAGVSADWCVVGGWAIDLWLGGQTRRHADIEVAIPRPQLPLMREHLSDYEIRIAGDGQIRKLPDGELPPVEWHQCWVLDTRANRWRTDIMLEPGTRETWIFRRDERVQAPRIEMIASCNNIPYLKPQAVLLYKAKACREKDEVDFRHCAPLLDDRSRGWLRDALKLVQPDHPWISRLG